MSVPRRARDRADDSLFTLLGDVPELVRNLVVAEVQAAKGWIAKTAKDYGIGAGWFVAALFVLFWMLPVLLAAAVAGLSVVWPVWLSALTVAGGMLLVIIVLALLGIGRFRRASKRENPLSAVKTDVSIVREVGDEF